MRNSLSTLAELACRILVETCLAGHLVIAILFWWFTPKGFALSHPRFWLNSMIPLAVIAITLVAIVGVMRRVPSTLQLAAIWVTALWTAAAAAASICFPVSLGRLQYLGVALFCLLALLLGVRPLRPTLRLLPAVLTALLAALLGGTVVWLQRPPPADKRPLNEQIRTTDAVEYLPSAPEPLGDQRWFYPSMGEVAVRRSGVTLQCSVLPSFDRISPDGFWSLLAPPPARARRVQTRAVRDAQQIYGYSDGSEIVLPGSTDQSRLAVTAYGIVKRPTYSHLNQFCRLELFGHRALAISFSPCSDTMIDVRPADYPSGRPARFAYLDGQDRFHVVEASSGEKGPFHELAAGSLEPGDPLTMTFFDEGNAVHSVTLRDWTQQLSTAASPTAGWRVPVNSIEFQRVGDEPDATAAVWISLAATAVGRGWDTVGHRTGTYRNRLEFH